MPVVAGLVHQCGFGAPAARAQIMVLAPSMEGPLQCNIRACFNLLGTARSCAVPGAVPGSDSPARTQILFSVISVYSAVNTAQTRVIHDSGGLQRARALMGRAPNAPLPMAPMRGPR